jgi:hypothetical protein
VAVQCLSHPQLDKFGWIRAAKIWVLVGTHRTHRLAHTPAPSGTGRVLTSTESALRQQAQIRHAQPLNRRPTEKQLNCQHVRIDISVFYLIS